MPDADKQPAQLLPLLYLGTAHIALGAACLFAACWPRAVAGFFYHPWLIGLVHLITLGWITFSILGAIYIVGPLALRMDMPARPVDYVAFAGAAVGLGGMVGDFWLQRYGGLAWSAATVAGAVVYMTVRIIAGIRRAKVQTPVKLHIVLGCVNFWLASSMGLLMAVDKLEHVLPGFVLDHVFAHAHLAALGWAMMMVVGVGYRLLPMVFPSKMPPVWGMYASAILLEVGVLGLFTTLLLGGAWAFPFGLAIVAGLAVFAGQVVWMRRHLVSKPAGAHAVEFSILHGTGAAVSLAAAAAIGLVLLTTPLSPRTLHAAAAYGVLGLVGCLAQMIVAMENRLLPMVAWFWSYGRSNYQVPPPSPHAMRDRGLQGIGFAAWTIGVPALAAGMAGESAALIALGAWALFAGVAITTLDNAFVVSQALRTRETAARQIA